VQLFKPTVTAPPLVQLPLVNAVLVSVVVPLVKLLRAVTTVTTWAVKPIKALHSSLTPVVPRVEIALPVPTGWPLLAPLVNKHKQLSLILRLR
jgi:hypothetical protein